MTYRKHFTLQIMALAALAYGMPASAADKQVKWDVAQIADSLRQGALSVVRCDDVTFTQTSATTGRRLHHRVISILSEQGDNHAVWSMNCDSYKQLGSFECRIFDATGKEIRKHKEKDLQRTEYSEHLMTDGCRYFFVPGKQAAYPYTIDYQWEEKVKNGISCYISSQPVYETRQSAEACHYQVIFTSGEVRTLAHNTDAQWQHTEAEGKQTYSISLPPFRNIADEDLLPSYLDLYPLVVASPQILSLDRYTGEVDTWQQYGDWCQQLWQGRQELPAYEHDSVAVLTAGLENDFDKVEALYDYLGRRTRYVSIQLGIGGWQPMTAQEVSRAGFGDCKGLSNYLHSLLGLTGISSYPVVIGTRYDRYLPDYPNFFQNNHCILCVPLATDTLWLDCTAAATIPCGIIPANLRNHDCLVLRPEGTLLTRIPNPVPQYITTAQITIGPDLQAQCQAEEMDYIGENKEIKKQFGKVMGNNTLIFPIDPYLEITLPKFRKGSAFPIYRSHDVCYIDSLHFTLAEGVSLESVPDLTDASTLNNRLTLDDETMQWNGLLIAGDWQIEIIREEHGLCVVVQLRRHAGTYPAAQKEEYINQIRQLNNRLNAKLVFRKVKS